MLTTLALAVLLPLVGATKEIPLAGVRGRIDHMAYDHDGKRLFMAALGNNTVEVVDLGAGKRVRSISGLREPQGVGYASNPGRLFVANGASGNCLVLDGRTLARTSQIELGEDADNVRYDPVDNRIYVGYGQGALAEIDPKSNKVLRTVSFHGHPEAFCIDRTWKRIYVNVPTEQEVVVIDLDRFTVSDRWPVKGARSNFPMALDERNGKLYIGCRSPARLLRFDVKSGKEDASADLGADVDDLFVVGSKVFAICGGGVLDVLDLAGHRTQRLPTKSGARTGLYLPDRHELVIAYPPRDGHEAGLLVLKQ